MFAELSLVSSVNKLDAAETWASSTVSTFSSSTIGIQVQLIGSSKHLHFTILKQSAQPTSFCENDFFCLQGIFGDLQFLEK